MEGSGIPDAPESAVEEGRRAARTDGPTTLHDAVRAMEAGGLGAPRLLVVRYDRARVRLCQCPDCEAADPGGQGGCGRPAGYLAATRALFHYANNKATAMECRVRGEIKTALVYERIADRIYDGLPTWARW